jgi:hypothetical protein
MSYIGNEPVISATRTITEIVATAGQTTFTANGGYTVGYVDVFVNGAQLQLTDFTATNGSTIVLNQAATVNDDVRIVAWGTFTTVNTYSVAETDAKIGNSGSVMFRNRIINGDMRIDQRNAGASVTPDNAYTLDRWRMTNTQTGKLTVQQDAGAVTPPAGFIDYLGITSTSAYSVLTGDTFTINQPIEGFNTSDLGWGTANAKTVTISFWVRSSLTGTFGGAIVNANATRSYPYSYTISAANTWEYKTVTVAGDTSGTWLTNASVGVLLRFGLGSGATFSGTAGAWASANLVQPTSTVSVVGTNGATFYITGVQLERGTVATPFEYRQYQQELALCQRYFVSYGGDDVYERYGFGINNTTTNGYPVIYFPVEMRAIPTLNVVTLASTALWDGVTLTTPTSFLIDMGTKKNMSVNVAVASGLTIRAPIGWLANNSLVPRIQFSAEL